MNRFNKSYLSDTHGIPWSSFDSPCQLQLNSLIDATSLLEMLTSFLKALIILSMLIFMSDRNKLTKQKFSPATVSLVSKLKRQFQKHKFERQSNLSAIVLTVRGHIIIYQLDKIFTFVRSNNLIQNIRTYSHLSFSSKKILLALHQTRVLRR